MCVYKWFYEEDVWKSLSALPCEFQWPHQLWIKCRRLKRSRLKWMDLFLTLHVLVMVADFLLPLHHSSTCLSGIPFHMPITTIYPSHTYCYLVYHHHLYLRLLAMSVKPEFKELKFCISAPTIAWCLFLEEESQWGGPLCYITSLVKSVNESCVKAE